MKNDKLLIISAIVAFSFGALQTTSTIASAKEIDEEMSPYKWGHWNKMVPPAAGPSMEISAPVVMASAPETPDPVEPPTVPTTPEIPEIPDNPIPTPTLPSPSTPSPTIN